MRLRVGSSHHLPLSAANLPAGNSARIVGVRSGSACAQRLGELGFQMDELVIIRRSGDPVILEIRGALLALDRQTAGDIELRDPSASPC